MGFKKKKISIFLIIIFISQQLLLNTHASPKFVTTNNGTNLDTYLIENVSYVGQDGPYCAYASTTMILKFYGINTSLREILFNSGVGYSFAYSNRKPTSGIQLSHQLSDRIFLADLYGLSYERWIADTVRFTHDECWQQYWQKIKENISNDIPILTVVNPFILPSLKEYFEIPKWIKWFDLSLPSSHAIVLLGYNESSEEICYNDPATALFGDAEKGKYVWMDISDFKKSVRTATGAAYFIEIFKNISASPFNKTEIFKIAHERNIERMKGNHSAYARRYEYFTLGIKGLQKLQQELEEETESHQFLIPMYKNRGVMVNLISKLHKTLNRSVQQMPKISNIFKNISIEKEDISNHLDKNIELLDVYQKEKKLLSDESEKWSELNLFYSKFIRKNIFLKKTEALNLIKKISLIVNEIISIENEIINLSENK
jgi:hypothetical protein